MINERNEHNYEIKQENKIYYLTTSIIENRIKFVCQDNSKNQLFKGEFSNIDLKKMIQYFKYRNLDQIQKNFIDIIKNQRVNIAPSLSIIFFFDNEQVVLPLRKTIPNNYNMIGFNQNNNNEYRNNQLINKNNIFPQPFNQGAQQHQHMHFIHQNLLNDGNNNAFNNSQPNNINYQNQINLLNKEINELKNQNGEIKEINQFLEKENGQLITQVDQLKINNDILLNQSQRLNEKKINDLEKSLKSKEKELVEKNIKISELYAKIKQLENLINTNNKDQIIEFELLKKLESKEKEIKEIKKIKLDYPFQLSRDEKIISVIFRPRDQQFIQSFPCKNTDQFAILESLLSQVIFLFVTLLGVIVAINVTLLPIVKLIFV